MTPTILYTNGQTGIKMMYLVSTSLMIILNAATSRGSEDYFQLNFSTVPPDTGSLIITAIHRNAHIS